MKILVLLLLLSPTLLFSGCCSTDNSPDDSQLPWARPADWEGGNPFVGAKSRQ